MTSNLSPFPQSSRSLTIIAWITVILISTIPDIVCMETSGIVPAWFVFVKICLLFILTVISFIRKRMRPLLNFFIIMTAFFGFSELRTNVDWTLSAIQGIFGNSVFDNRMQAEQTGKLIESAAMIALLYILGYQRRDFFLTRGNLQAPITPVPLLGFPKPISWKWFALQWAFYIAATLAIIQYLGLRPNGEVLMTVVPIIPSILFYAALNAFNEEITYRSSMLATLESVAGSKQALWISAYFFGIGHYFGTPGGIIGGIASIFMGWILGKGMIETRGFVWTWWIHFLSDVVIFTFLAMALVM
jgi:hypothetical protein